MLNTSLWWVRPGVGLIFYGLFVQSPFLCSFFYSFFMICFLLICFGCVLFSKTESFCLSSSFDFFVFYLFVLRLESDLQKNYLYSFKLVLIWFGYRGFSFLSHAIKL